MDTDFPPRAVAILTSESPQGSEALLLDHNHPRYIGQASNNASINPNFRLAAELSNGSLVLSLDDGSPLRPKNPLFGFTFGFDPSLVDILLAPVPRHWGVSRLHFSIQVHPDGGLQIMNHSQHPIDLEMPSGVLHRIGTDGSYQLRSDTKIKISGVAISIFIPTAVKQDHAYHTQLAEYRAVVGRAETPTGAPASGAMTVAESSYITYNAKHPLREGSVGTVYKAWSTANPLECYAVKSFSPATHRVNSAKEQVELLKSLDHPHVVRVYPGLTVEGLMSEHIVMELAPHGSLVDVRRRRGPPAPYELYVIFVQTLEAISYLHRCNPAVAHRDIKPANILVRRIDPWEVILADFDTAKRSKPSSRPGAATAYAAPEAVEKSLPEESEAYYSTRVDLWSIGVVLWEFARLEGLPSALIGHPKWHEIIARLARSRVGAKPHQDFVLNLAAELLLMNPTRRPLASTAVLSLRRKAADQVKSLFKAAPGFGSTVDKAAFFVFFGSTCARPSAEDYRGVSTSLSVDEARDYVQEKGREATSLFEPIFKEMSCVIWEDDEDSEDDA